MNGLPLLMQRTKPPFCFLIGIAKVTTFGIPFLSQEVSPKECLRLTRGRIANNTTLENMAVSFMTVM